MGEKEGFMVEEKQIEDLYRVDFFIPSANLCINVLSYAHLYPETMQLNQLENFKATMIKKNGLVRADMQVYRVLNLTTPILNACKNDPSKLESLLKAALKKETNKVEEVEE